MIFYVFFLMIRRPPRSTRTDTLFPYTTLFRSVGAQTIKDLANAMTSKRTMLNVAWSLQRADHGEQPFWMVVTLAAMLGQVGLPGGGFAVGYGPANTMGNNRSEEHTSELQSLMRISYAVFCLKKKKNLQRSID